MTGEVPEAIRSTQGSADGCVWEERGGRRFCATHERFGRRTGLGKLYRVTTATGQFQLVRAPDPASAKAAVRDAERVERAAPADGDFDPVLDTRQIIHVSSKAAKAPSRGDGQLLAEPSMPVAGCPSGWEVSEATAPRPSAWERGLTFGRHLLRALDRRDRVSDGKESR
jgi:hypothetical protein